MHSVDYPFSTNTDGWAFVERLAQAQVLSDTEMDMFAWNKVEKLLKLWVADIDVMSSKGNRTTIVFACGHALAACTESIKESMMSCQDM